MLEKPENTAEETNQHNFDVIIIGGGPAGSTAAIYTARAGLTTLVIDKGLTTGALGVTSKIVNYPGCLEEIGGADLLEKIRDQAKSFGARYITDRVIGVDLLSETKTVYTNMDTYFSRSVIIATGSMGRKNLVKGEQEYLGRGVSYCAVCDAAFFREKEVAVAGNNDEAVEEALYLSRFVKKVHFLSPTPEIKASESLLDSFKAQHNIKIYQGASLREVSGNGRVQAVRFGGRGHAEMELSVDGAFIYLQGGQPITDFLQGQLEVTDNGCIVVNREFRTAAAGVYAIGDVLCNHVKQAVIAAGDGSVAGIAVEKYLSGRKRMAFDWAK